MWFRDYQDYESDGYLKKQRDTRPGMNGCEMRERAGWGEQHQEWNTLELPRQPGLLSMLSGWLLGAKLRREK